MNITCFCTLEAGLLTIKLALDLGVKISRVIGLNPKLINSNDKISGYVDISHFCKKNKLDFKFVNDYSLKTINPSSIMTNTDIIWITGWQRLLPTSFINFSNISTLGSHGSCDGILKGRGRSPQNWALLMGMEKFKISMFKVTPGVDSGDTIITKEFKYGESDDIFKSYFKASICTAKSFYQIYKNPNLIKNAKVQKGKPEYFPKRLPKDGFIDWSMSSIDIFNQIRSLSKPYPCARSIIKGDIVLINKASYCEDSFNKKVGKIIYHFHDGRILVSCGKGSLIIEEYEIKNKRSISTESYFKSVSMKKTIKNIIKNFKKDFPEKNINKTLLRFWKKRDLI